MLHSGKRKSFGRLSLGLGALLGLLSLAGCDLNSTVSAEPYVPYDSADLGDLSSLQANVTLWVSSEGRLQTTLSSLAVSFLEEYSGIHITIEGHESQKTLESKVSSALASGTNPTMAFLSAEMTAVCVESKTLLDATSFLEDPALSFRPSDNPSSRSAYGEEDFVPSFWKEGSSYGAEGRYSVPLRESNEVLFYNKTFFDSNHYSLASSWEELWNLGNVIREKEASVHPVCVVSDSNLFITLSAQKGIPFTAVSGDHYLFNNPEAKQLVSDLVGESEKGNLLLECQTKLSEPPLRIFLEGKSPLLIGSSSLAARLQDAPFAVGVSSLPRFESASERAQFESSSLSFFLRSSRQEKYAAWLFYKYCLRAENSRLIAECDQGYLPIRYSALSADRYRSAVSASFQDTLPFVSAQALDSYFAPSAFKGAAQAKSAVGGIFASILLDSKSIDDAFKSALTQCLS
jgi:multiple sugar transport system substrate-binding protein